MKGTDLIIFGGAAIVIIIAFGMMVWSVVGIVQHEQDFSIGSTVTTTTEYEYLTNSTFTGVVVRGEARHDPSLTIHSRDGTERRIATKFLKPVE